MFIFPFHRAPYCEGYRSSVDGRVFQQVHLITPTVVHTAAILLTRLITIISPVQTNFTTETDSTDTAYGKIGLQLLARLSARSSIHQRAHRTNKSAYTVVYVFCDPLSRSCEFSVEFAIRAF